MILYQFYIHCMEFVVCIKRTEQWKHINILYLVTAMCELKAKVILNSSVSLSASVQSTFTKFPIIFPNFVFRAYCCFLYLYIFI